MPCSVLYAYSMRAFPFKHIADYDIHIWGLVSYTCIDFSTLNKKLKIHHYLFTNVILRYITLIYSQYFKDDPFDDMINKMKASVKNDSVTFK